MRFESLLSSPRVRYLPRFFCAAARAVSRRRRYPPTVAPCRNRCAAIRAAAAALGFGLHAGFCHDGDVGLALAISPLAISRATAHALRLELPTAASAADRKAIPSRLQSAVICFRLAPALGIARIAVVVEIAAPIRTEPLAATAHALAACVTGHCRFRLRIIGAQQVALDNRSNGFTLQSGPPFEAERSWPASHRRLGWSKLRLERRSRSCPHWSRPAITSSALPEPA